MDGDLVFLKELIDLFVADCPSQMSMIAEAIAERDAGKLLIASHTLKGSASNFFAHSVVAAAHRLEVRGRSGDLSGAETDLANLEHAINDLGKALDAVAEEIHSLETELTSTLVPV